MIVDVHAHVIVPEITRAAGDDAWRPDVRWEGGEQIVTYAGRSIRSAVHEFVRVDEMMREALGCGVEGLVLSPWVALLPDAPDLDDSLRICRIQNAALAALARAHPGRIRALGAVPLHHPDAAAAELRASMAEGGLCGVEVPASVRGDYLGDDRFLPFWEAAADTGAVVFVHPTTRGFELPVFEGYYLWNTVANPMETAVTGAHLVMAGVLERFPGLRIVLAHGGGALASVRGRLRRAHAFQPQARERLQEPPDVSLQRLYFDTVTHDAELLRSLIDWVGADRVLLGSDRPFDMGTDRPVEEVRALGLTPEDEAHVLGGNAERLIGGFG